MSHKEESDLNCHTGMWHEKVFVEQSLKLAPLFFTFVSYNALKV